MYYTEILQTIKQKQNLKTYKEVIYEFPYDTFKTMMEDCVNKNLNDRNRKF